MYLVFDCETTGFPSKDLPKDHPKQARMVSLAAAMLNREFQIIAQFSCYLQCTPYQIIIPEHVTKIHGITQQFADHNGISRVAILGALLPLFKLCKVFCAYNVGFDWSMLNIELQSTETRKPEHLSQFCIMANSRDLVAKKSPLGTKPRYSLDHTYETLFGMKLEKHHDATADLYAAISILKYIGINHSEKLAVYHDKIPSIMPQECKSPVKIPQGLDGIEVV